MIVKKDAETKKLEKREENLLLRLKYVNDAHQ